MGSAGEKRHILVVDDEPSTAAFVGAVLEGAGFSVSLASSSSEALDVIDGESPSAVVTDVMMPGPSGIALLAYLRADPETAGLPVVVVTSSPDQYPEWATGAMKQAAFLRKPLEPATLLEAVRRVLGDA